MSDGNDNSVLFSLKELKKIETSRVEEERTAKLLAEEARKRAQEEALRREQDAEQARIRAEQDAIRQKQEDEERRAREEQLKLEAAARLVQVKEQAQLEKKLLDEEMQAREHQATKAKPIALVAIAVALVAAAIGSGVYLYGQYEESQALEEAYQAKVRGLQSKVAAKKARIRGLLNMKESRYDAILAASVGPETETAEANLKSLEEEITGEKAQLRKLQREFEKLAEQGVDGPSEEPSAPAALSPPESDVAPAAPTAE